MSPLPILSVAFVAALSLLVFGPPRLILSWECNTTGDASISFFSIFSIQARAESAAPEPARLIVTQPVSRMIGEATPLGVAGANLGDNDLVIVSGLENGAGLSAGSRVSDRTWTLFGRETKNVVIQPAPQFVGTMDVLFELLPSSGAGAITDRQSVRFEWVASKTQKVELAVVRQESKPSRKPDRQLSAQDVAALLKRGNDLISSGDLAAARLVLKPAAEAGDARAAELLAETYDPLVLQKVSAHGMVPEPSIAQFWYEKAKERGSADAQRRLQILASTPH